jgi:hypothetical protein
MHRLLEFILGLPRGFLNKEGELTLTFNPQWPGQSVIGAGVWNFVLIALALALVVYVYRRESRTTAVRITLGIIRGRIASISAGAAQSPRHQPDPESHRTIRSCGLIDKSIQHARRDAGEGATQARDWKRSNPRFLLAIRRCSRDFRVSISCAFIASIKPLSRSQRLPRPKGRARQISIALPSMP